MIVRKPYFGPCKLVLAFDIGTTYSGISYCILQPGEIHEMRGVTRFPGQEKGQGNAKVPSILYYDKSGHIQAAGSDALAEDVIARAEDEGWAKAEWWKLHLRPKHLASNHIKDDQIYPLPPGISATDVLTDFITYLFRCTKDYILERHIGFNWPSIENSIEFIFTHPNGWEGLQQQQYREAIERAGLIPRTPEGRSRVRMITEGEASLHYCISSLPEKPTNTEPEGLVIIDAGGGTIDLSMYLVAFNPISCEEIAPAECRLQGSVFVTQRAKGLLKKKLKSSPYCKDEEMNVILREFDQTTKLTISDPMKPVYVKIGSRLYNDKQYNIFRGSLKLSGAEATGLFDKSIKAIISAFDEQCKSVQSKITMAFLVGGLGANEFVWTCLQSHFKERGIDISRPDNDINKSVANGAVLFSVNRLVRVRVARATYGVRCFAWVNETNAEHRRRRDQWEKDASGRYIINGCFHPILHKGDKVDEDQETRHSFHFSHKSQDEFGGEEVEIMCYRGTSSHPEWIDKDPSSFTNACTIRADLSKAAKHSVSKKGVSGEVYYTVEFDVVAFFGTTEWTAQMAWKMKGNEQRTPAMINYYDNDD